MMIEKRRNDKVFERITDAKARKQVLDVIEKHDLLKATCDNLAFWGRRLSTASPERIRQAAVDALLTRLRRSSPLHRSIMFEKESAIIDALANAIGKISTAQARNIYDR